MKKCITRLIWMLLVSLISACTSGFLFSVNKPVKLAEFTVVSNGIDTSYAIDSIRVVEKTRDTEIRNRFAVRDIYLEIPGIGRIKPKLDKPDSEYGFTTFRFDYEDQKTGSNGQKVFLYGTIEPWVSCESQIEVNAIGGSFGIANDFPSYVVNDHCEERKDAHPSDEDRAWDYDEALALASETHNPDACKKINVDWLCCDDYGVSAEEAIESCKVHYAIDSNNPELCKTLSDSAEWKKSDKENKCYKDMALKFKRIELCEKVDAGSYDGCVAPLADTIEHCKNMYGWTQTECLTKVALLKNDISICDGVSTEENKPYCQLPVLMSQWVKEPHEDWKPSPMTDFDDVVPGVSYGPIGYNATTCPRGIFWNVANTVEPELKKYFPEAHYTCACYVDSACSKGPSVYVTGTVKTAQARYRYSFSLPYDAVQSKVNWDKTDVRTFSDLKIALKEAEQDKRVQGFFSKRQDPSRVYPVNLAAGSLTYMDEGGYHKGSFYADFVLQGPRAYFTGRNYCLPMESFSPSSPVQWLIHQEPELNDYVKTHDHLHVCHGENDLVIFPEGHKAQAIRIIIHDKDIFGNNSFWGTDGRYTIVERQYERPFLNGKAFSDDTENGYLPYDSRRWGPPKVPEERLVDAPILTQYFRDSPGSLHEITR